MGVGGAMDLLPVLKTDHTHDAYQSRWYSQNSISRCTLPLTAAHARRPGHHRQSRIDILMVSRLLEIAPGAGTLERYYMQRSIFGKRSTVDIYSPLRNVYINRRHSYIVHLIEKDRRFTE